MRFLNYNVPLSSNGSEETASSSKTGSSAAGAASKIAPPLASPDPDATGFLSSQNAANGNKGLDSTLDISSSSLNAGPAHISVSPIVCRICYSTCGTLYSFCRCKGSVGYVHKDCLKRWIDTNRKANRCEICQSLFTGTEWSFKPIRKWASPRMGVLDKLYLALFICCSVIVLYSIPWISYKAWRSRDVIFGDGPVTSERIFALIVIAIYVPLNISCIASLVVLWRRAVQGVCQRFLDVNKQWRIRVTRDVAETKLINAVNSTVKSPSSGDKKNQHNADDHELLTDVGAMTPIKRLDSSPNRFGTNGRNVKTLTPEEAGLLSAGETSNDSTTMLLTSTLKSSRNNKAKPVLLLPPTSSDGHEAETALGDNQQHPNSHSYACNATPKSFGTTEV